MGEMASRSPVRPDLLVPPVRPDPVETPVGTVHAGTPALLALLGLLDRYVRYDNKDIYMSPRKGGYNPVVRKHVRTCVITSTNDDDDDDLYHTQATIYVII